jgi:signal transduction histidine kinase
MGSAALAAAAAVELEASRSDRDLLHLILDSVGDGVVVADADHRIVLANPAAARLTDVRVGDTLAAWLDRTSLRFRDDGRPIGLDDFPLARALRGEETDGIELTTAGESGRATFVSATARPMAAPIGRSAGAVMALRDVTDKVAAELALTQRARELARSNGQLDEFAYVASHDLQEPLRMVTAYCELLRRRYEGRLDADADEFIGYAVEGASRMRQLINDLLLYSRVRRQDVVPTEEGLDGVVDLALANLEKALEETGTLVTRPASLPRVYGNRGQLVQLFQNVVGNAIKFRQPEATPRIAIEASQATPDGTGWRVTVTDNGIGVDPRFADRIFAPFQRLHTRDAYDGSGIGLAVCKAIMERHGGDIGVDPDYRDGARFWMDFPSEGSLA